MDRLSLAGLSPEQLEMVDSILQAALDAADPRQAVKQALQREGNYLITAGQKIDLRSCRRIRLVGAGKAAQAMAKGILELVGDVLQDGLIITKHLETPGSLPGRIRVLPGGHPIPSAESVASTRALVEFLSGGEPGDLVFCLISGGGSALMTLPVGGVSLEMVRSLTGLLLACGADITEMNTLRKHLDQVKGGGLARFAAPARVISLILSDVIGSPLDVIASGPTTADTTTYSGALAVLRKYGIEERTPGMIRQVLERGARGELPETVKPGDPVLSNVSSLVVASNPLAADAALSHSRKLGFHTLLLTTYLQGEASQAGLALASILKQVAASGQPLPRPACLVAGGETTVTLKGKGSGGRNQEMALGAAFLLDGARDVALVTLGTDGEDGPTDAAGALATGDTMRRARAAGLSPLGSLRENDSYHFFQALGDLVKTGPTGTNVNDLAFLFAF